MRYYPFLVEIEIESNSGLNSFFSQLITEIDEFFCQLKYNKIFTL
jgi:hypothetical protein